MTTMYLIDFLEEEVGTSCLCPECKETAVLLRVLDTQEHTEEFFSNCCYAEVEGP